MSVETEIYRTKHTVRFVTAASLFDGHDASINLFRRLLQASGAEVIHLGHNRSVDEIVQYILLHLIESSSPLVHSNWLTQPSRLGSCNSRFCNAWLRKFVVNCYAITLA